jgi:pilus assembly protein CpaB
MDRRFLTVLAVSLLFALVVSTLFYQMSARARRASQKPEKKIESVNVVIATSEMPVGVTIKPADVQVVKMPSDQFPKGAFSGVEEVLGRPVISNILAGEPVVEGRLAERGSGFGLAPVIPIGMRAVAVRVNDVVGVAGFVLPGIRVDVLVTLRPPGDAGARTTTVLQNIIVLSAGQTIQPDGSGKAIEAPVVTLLVTPEQAEVLTLAGNEGKIQLVLRNGGDQNVKKTPGRRISELYGSFRPDAGAVSKPKPPKVALLPPPPAVSDEIVVIRGTHKSVEVLREPESN